jgi:hypothetical protein
LKKHETTDACEHSDDATTMMMMAVAAAQLPRAHDLKPMRFNAASLFGNDSGGTRTGSSVVGN